ncbi:hypothetical protein ACFYQ5_03645 [Streptomyces sp. NPDC005794]|uniref:hypothetical protein n=1 Tax=Streptomyces sp. NPDC005794 TaxID=3364733 RepID=UPI0036902687
MTWAPDNWADEATRPSQYTSSQLVKHLASAAIVVSIGSVGDAYDNALMASAIGLFKTELIEPGRPWRTFSQAELTTAEWPGTATADSTVK